MGDQSHSVRAADRFPAVYFLSDYGTADEFVGVVHAVLHRLAPAIPVIDLSHQIPPFDVAAGAGLLVRCAPHLGAGVVLAVIDPDVGTDRRGVAVETLGDGPAWLVGPDNGLLVPVAEALGGIRRVISLRPGPAAHGPSSVASAPSAGRTFDGRDLFAPAAAHLALAGSPAELGTEADPASLQSPEHVASEGAHRGPLVGASAGAHPGATAVDGPELEVPVTWIDRFGNIQLETGPEALEAIGVGSGGTAWVTVARPTADGPSGRLGAAGDHGVRPQPARRVAAFGDLDPDELGLLIDSNGRLALVLRQASAAGRLNPLAVGDIVRIASGCTSTGPG